MQRPSVELLESAYDELFHSTLDKLKDSALHGRLFQSKYNKGGIPGRSIAWKLFLTRQPPLTASLDPHPIPPLDSLRHSRSRYVTLLREKMCAPDGSYEEGFNALSDTSGEHPSASRVAHVSKKLNDWTLNNPLSLDHSNPWHAYFSALELRDTIKQDVERTFPELPYFRSSEVQNEMTHILFLHVSERENIGYRQGMHELLACIYQAVDFDSIEKSESPVSSKLGELCDRKYVAADTFALFGTLMDHMENWYEWRPSTTDPVSPRSPARVPHISANGEIVTPTPQVDVLENGQLDLKQYVAPIVPICASLRDEKLRAVDPHLWAKLRDGGVEPQMYGIRWLRLLFTREFSVVESMIIWDGLFASVSEEPTSPSSRQGFELALWISVAMLIRIRNILIPGDYTTQLTHLLRYPEPTALGASSGPSNAPILLLNQAQLLITSPTPATGATVVMQNRNDLGIPVETLDPPAHLPKHQRRSTSVIAPPTLSGPQSRMSQSQDRPRLQDMITNRLIDANESLGIQRGFFNTITELRKNLPDLSQSLIRTPSWNGSSMTLVDERRGSSNPSQSSTPSIPEIVDRAPWEPKPRSEIEREVTELRALLKTLGNAVGWAVDVLLLDEDSGDLKDAEKSLQQRKAEAIECMAYVRDVLARGGKGDIDEERLVSEEEYQRQRRLKQEKQRVGFAVHSQPSLPKPVFPPPRIGPPEDSLNPMAKPGSTFAARDSARPIPYSTRTVSGSSGTPPFIVTSAVPVPHSTNDRSMTGSTASKVFSPPWQHTPSNFSGESLYTSTSLPRPPPPSTTAPVRLDRSSSDHPGVPSNNHDPPRTDPLGVLRGQI